MEIPKVTIKHAEFIIVPALIVFGVMLRLLPHEPNVAPVGAIALFGGAVFGWRAAIGLPLGILILSDLVIGMYPGIQYTWIGFLLVAIFGMALRKVAFLPRVAAGAFGSAAIFFVVSNAGVWLAGGLYPHTIAGLEHCYAAAIPFFRPTLLGDGLYGSVLFGAYALALRWADARCSAPANVR